MDPSKHGEPPLSSPESSSTSSTWFSIPPSSYLTVPSTRPSGTSFSLPGPTTFALGDLDLDPQQQQASPSNLVPRILEPLRASTPTRQNASVSPLRETSILPLRPTYMPVCSATSESFEQSFYSNPHPRIYRIPSFQDMSTSRRISLAEKDQMIQALHSHQVNTLVELRRIERAFAILGSPDVTEPMTAAWSYYVNSHSLLTELRGLTKNYPFSSDCLEEAKRRVYSDPQSNRSWNLCWLVLTKIRTDQLIPYYAQYQAEQPTMWGGQTPSPESTTQLSNAFVAEWEWAVGQMLRHWDQPPTR